VPLLIARDFLDQSFCPRPRGDGSRRQRRPPRIGTAITIHLTHAVRRTRSVEIDTPLLEAVERRLDGIRRSIERASGVPTGEREGTGFLRYEPGGFYLPHRDRGAVAGWPLRPLGPSRWSCS
jgi:hypothetical protein